VAPSFVVCEVPNPCATPFPVKRGDAFTIGLAIIPGGNATGLLSTLASVTGDPQSTNTGYCNPTFQAELSTNYSANLAVYTLRIDRLQVLKIPFTEILFPMTAATQADPPRPATLTVVAFRNGIRSSPVYLASGTPLTGGAGFVISLALMVRFEDGVLAGLNWYDMTCNDCGGKSSLLCVQQLDVNSCATSFYRCNCTAFAEDSANKGRNCSLADPWFMQCSTSLNTGFLGTDRNGEAFRTGAQVQRLNAFSIVSLFYRVKDQVTATYSSINSAWSGMQDEANGAQAEFGGGWTGRGGAGAATSPPPPPPSPPTPPSPEPPMPRPPRFPA